MYFTKWVAISPVHFGGLFEPRLYFMELYTISENAHKITKAESFAKMSPGEYRLLERCFFPRSGGFSEWFLRNPKLEYNVILAFQSA